MKKLFQQELNFLCPAVGPSQWSPDPVQSVFPPTSPLIPVETPQSQEETQLVGSGDEYDQYSYLSLGLKLIWMCSCLLFNDLTARSSCVRFYSMEHTLIYKHFILRCAQQKKGQPRLTNIDYCHYFGASRKWLYPLKYS